MASRRASAGQMGDSIYAYETTQGRRFYFKFRDPSGRQTTKRGFLTKRDAGAERERLMGRVHRGEFRVSRESLGEWWLRCLAGRRPYLENGSWQDYRRHGEKRILPHLGPRKLTSVTAPELRQWLVELAETGTWAPKTLNNALKALVVCLNHAVADGLLGANPAGYVKALPLGHIERDYLRWPRSAATSTPVTPSTGRWRPRRRRISPHADQGLAGRRLRPPGLPRVGRQGQRAPLGYRPGRPRRVHRTAPGAIRARRARRRCGVRHPPAAIGTVLDWHRRLTIHRRPAGSGRAGR